LGAYYLERWSVIHILCKFKFIPAKEYVFMIAPNKCVISSPTSFSTSVQCDKMLALIIQNPPPFWKYICSCTQFC
jgi:hypothetical protein